MSPLRGQPFLQFYIQLFYLFIYFLLFFSICRSEGFHDMRMCIWFDFASTRAIQYIAEVAFYFANLKLFIGTITVTYYMNMGLVSSNLPDSLFNHDSDNHSISTINNKAVTTYISRFYVHDKT